MNRIELDEALKSLSGTSTGTDGLIWITDDADNLTQRPYNFVEVQAGRYEIWRPGDRGQYIKSVSRSGVPDSPVFQGTLEEAFDWVYSDRVKLFRQRDELERRRAAGRG